MRFVAALSGFLLLAHAALATTLTALCGEPTGYAVGIVRGNQSVDGKEGITGGSFTISWSGGNELTIMSRDAVGNSETTKGVIIASEVSGGGQLHFLEPDKGEVWFYTLFVGAQRLLISAHQSFPAALGGGVVGKVMQSSCSISFAH